MAARVMTIYGVPVDQINFGSIDHRAGLITDNRRRSRWYRRITSRVWMDRREPFMPQ
jgi:hypothetical protein